RTRDHAARNGAAGAQEREGRGKQGAAQEAREGIGGAEGEVVRAESRMAEGEIGHRFSAETERGTRPGPDRTGKNAAARGTGEGKRAAIRADSRAREKTARRRGEDQRERQPFASRRSDGGRYRAGRLEL